MARGIYGAIDIRDGGAGERRRVGEIEEVGAELQVLAFADFENAAHREVEVFLPRAAETVAADVAVTGGAVHANDRRMQEGGGLQIAVEAVAAGHGIAAGETRSEEGRDEVGAAGLHRGSPGGVNGGKGLAGLQRQHAAEDPAAEEMRGQAILILIKRLFVSEAGDGAMGVVEVGRTTGGERIVFVVEAGIEGNAGGRSVVDGLRPGIGALEIETVGEAMDEGGLERVVMRVGVGNKGFIGAGAKPGKGARALALEALFWVIMNCVPFWAATVMGFCGLAKRARLRSLVSRRCRP